MPSLDLVLTLEGESSLRLKSAQAPTNRPHQNGQCGQRETEKLFQVFVEKVGLGRKRGAGGRGSSMT